jgi:hypothetical protein
MKKTVVPLLFVCCFAMTACCHTYDMDIQGHRVTQLRTWDVIGPSTVGFYESINGKLAIHQQASGNILGEIAQGVGTAYAGERIGDGMKNQEPDQTNVNNEAEAEGGNGGGGGSGGDAWGGSATGGSATGGNATGGRAYGVSATSVSGASAGAVSNASSQSQSTGFRGYKPKPAAMKPATKPPAKPIQKPLTSQNISVRNNVTK